MSLAWGPRKGKALETQTEDLTRLWTRGPANFGKAKRNREEREREREQRERTREGEREQRERETTER